MCAGEPRPLKAPAGSPQERRAAHQTVWKDSAIPIRSARPLTPITPPEEGRSVRFGLTMTTFFPSDSAFSVCSGREGGRERRAGSS